MNGLLAIVPARGGSKGVPRKNMRLLAGRPLLEYTLTAVAESGVAERVLLSSDDPVTLDWARVRGYQIHERDPSLASDTATISDLAAAVADQLDWQGTVGVFQPTSPLRRAASITRAVETFQGGGWDSLASCVRESHLFWFEAENPDDPPQPLFAARVNRQFARSRVLRETGSIQLVRAAALRSGRQMVTPNHRLFEMAEDESLDIDTFEDLVFARRRLERATVVFRLTAHSRVGSGHLFHCLQLAEELDEHDIRFLLRDCDPFVGETLTARGHEWATEGVLREDLERARGTGTNLIVNDILDTTEHDVLEQRAAGYLVVNIEDLGPGARLAHWVVNALYRADDRLPDAAVGPRWATLREEFHDPPEKVVREDGSRILITFGGTDPNHLAARCSTLLAGVPGLELRVVVGPGASAENLPEGVEIVHRVRSMSAEMVRADLVLTSAGRTIYEAAATGTPVVVLAQNAREATHAHLGYETGVVFLGIGPLVDDEHIVETVRRLREDATLRGELSARLRRSVDARGAMRIANRIRTMITEQA
jgi:CMP-N-acetylneuraminic acid synthetase/spore coat polysaccharide biosynthesis predicted glycosyltransferase SpsG